MRWMLVTSWIVGGDLLPECVDENCCAPFCDITMPEQCEALTCLPWYDEGQAPPGLEQVGVCVAG